MYKSQQNSKFVLLEENLNDSNELKEFHYKGGIVIQNDMLNYDKKNGQIYGGASVEKNQYKEYENKVVPFALAYNSHNDTIRVGGGIIPDQVIPEEIHNKLFFSVAHEINHNGNKKTMKKLK
jgi:hypothetical protein